MANSTAFSGRGVYCVACDLHSNPTLVKSVLSRMPDNATLLLNGDTFGGRGVEADKIVRLFYIIRNSNRSGRGSDAESMERLKNLLLDYISPSYLSYILDNALHSGIFLNAIMQKSADFNRYMMDDLNTSVESTAELILYYSIKKNIRVYVITGNGEQSPICDFDTSETITEERLIPEDERFYANMAKRSLSDYVFSFVDGIKMFDNGLAVMGMGAYGQSLPEETKILVTHFPNSVKLLQTLPFLENTSYSSVEERNCNLVAKSLAGSNVEDVFCGHFHLGIDESLLNEDDCGMPQSAQSHLLGSNIHWQKPGTLYCLNNNRFL